MKKAWMISTACAAVLALGGAASAQGMNEHGGKNAPAAEQKGAAPAPMNKTAPARAGNAQNMEKGAAPNRAGSAQNMEKNNAPKANAQGSAQGNEKAGSAKTAQDNEKAGARSKTGQDMSKQPNSRSAAEERGKGAKSSEKVGEQKSGNSMNKEPNRAAAGQNGRSTTGSASSAEVKLTTEQRTKIRKVVVDEKKIPRLTKVNFDIKVGVRVPRTVHFYSVPEEIVTIHPAWRSYRVIFVNEELVLIDPTTFEIMYVFAV